MKFKIFVETYKFKIVDLDTTNFVITICESINSYELQFEKKAINFIEDICLFILGENERDYLSFINDNENNIDDYKFIDRNTLFLSYINEHCFIRTENIIPNNNSIICIPLLENKFTIQANAFLNKEIIAYYNTNFYGYGKPNNPDYLNVLKNDNHQNWSEYQLNNAANKLKIILLNDLPLIADIERTTFTVCVLPRAKVDSNYRANQLLFKATLKDVILQLGVNFSDGTDYITRINNTKTTHLRKPMEGFNNDGSLPYVGITNETCTITDEVIGKDILLIDDIYTRTVNIDEDAIQALLSRGAKSVIFYAVGNTVYNN